MKPSILPVTDVAENAKVLKNHFLDLMANYVAPYRSDLKEPSIYVVNLIDKHGMQGTLGRWLYAAFNYLSQNIVEASSDDSSESTLSRPSEESAMIVVGADGEANETVERIKIDPDSLIASRLLEESNEKVAKVIDEIAEQHNNDKDELLQQLTDRDLTLSKDFSFTAHPNVLHGATKKIDDFKSRLIWFDFHRKCRNGNVSAVQELLPLILPALSRNDGMFLSTKDQSSQRNSVKSLQKYIIRTNCIDCLDRTNVAQVRIYCPVKTVLLSNCFFTL